LADSIDPLAWGVPAALADRYQLRGFEGFSDAVISSTSQVLGKVMLWSCPIRRSGDSSPDPRDIGDSAGLAGGPIDRPATDFGEATVVGEWVDGGTDTESEGGSGRRWIIAEHVDGHHLAERSHPINPQRAVELLAGSLQWRRDQLFGASATVVEPSTILSDIRTRLAGVDGEAIDLSPAYRHMAMERLVEILAVGVDHQEPARSATAHGDARLCNVIATPELATIVGFEPGLVISPLSDLVTAATDVAERFGPMLVPVLFESSGHAGVDPVAVDWWALANELLRVADTVGMARDATLAGVINPAEPGATP